MEPFSKVWNLEVDFHVQMAVCFIFFASLLIYGSVWNYRTLESRLLWPLQLFRDCKWWNIRICQCQTDYWPIVSKDVCSNCWLQQICWLQKLTCLPSLHFKDIPTYLWLYKYYLTYTYIYLLYLWNECFRRSHTHRVVHRLVQWVSFSSTSSHPRLGVVQNYEAR